jgi:uncharacterized membrane protein YidH (DUF202 family)
VGQRSAAWNAGINWALPALALGLLGTAQLARHAPRVAFAVAGVLVASGFLLFADAKASRIRQGHRASFGTTGMTRRHRIRYGLGYVLMVAGTVVTAGFLIAWP